MSDESSESKSTQPVDEPNENADHPRQIDSIPGGERQILPEEPKPPADPPRSAKNEEKTMGACTSSKTVDQNDQKSNENAPRQRKTSDFSPEKSARSPSPSQTNSAAKKMKKERSPSPPPDYDSDFENDNEKQKNASSKNSRGPVTRSATAMSRISIEFQDSDHDDNDVSRWAKRDIEEYRSGYPGLRQNSQRSTNLKFYTNEISSHPDGDFIEVIHKKWRGNYRKLEYHHGFIQWLFPLQEAGLNWSADPLQKHEIEAIKKDKKAMERILVSYEMMLDFYGFELKDRQTGEVIRATEGDWRDRFDNLNTSSHNYLRITRILKCLGEFDYEYLKYPFLRAILREAITENQIPRCLRSCRDYWIETLKNQEDRRKLREFARKLIKYRNENQRPPDSLLRFEPATEEPKSASKPAFKHHRQSSDV